MLTTGDLQACITSDSLTVMWTCENSLVMPNVCEHYDRHVLPGGDVITGLWEISYWE